MFKFKFIKTIIQDHLTMKWHQRPQINLMASRWNESTLNMVGNSFQPTPFRSRWMNLHRCHKPTPTRTGLSPHRLYITFKTSWFYFERLQNEIAKWFFHFFWGQLRTHNVPTNISKKKKTHFTCPPPLSSKCHSFIFMAPSSYEGEETWAHAREGKFSKVVVLVQWRMSRRRTHNTFLQVADSIKYGHGYKLEANVASY